MRTQNLIIISNKRFKKYQFTIDSRTQKASIAQLRHMKRLFENADLKKRRIQIEATRRSKRISVLQKSSRYLSSDASEQHLDLRSYGRSFLRSRVYFWRNRRSSRLWGPIVCSISRLARNIPSLNLEAWNGLNIALLLQSLGNKKKHLKKKTTNTEKCQRKNGEIWFSGERRRRGRVTEKEEEERERERCLI